MHSAQTVFGPTTQHSATLPRPADHQHQLLRLPSQHTFARSRAAMPHDTPIRSPRCTGQTARRLTKADQHPGPPPWPKSQTASSEACCYAVSTEPTALPYSNTRPTPKPYTIAPPHEASGYHGSRGHHLSTHPPSGAAAQVSIDPIWEVTRNRQLTL
jgi:hypothetical protein